MEKQPCVYILSSKKNGTLYTGVTSNITKRTWEHKSNLVSGFTDRYGVHDLVWYELHPTMQSAIQREKAIKKWNRAWKTRLINKQNPGWKDLYSDVLGVDSPSPTGDSPSLYQEGKGTPEAAGNDSVREKNGNH